MSNVDVFVENKIIVDLFVRFSLYRFKLKIYIYNIVYGVNVPIFDVFLYVKYKSFVWNKMLTRKLTMTKIGTFIKSVRTIWKHKELSTIDCFFTPNIDRIFTTSESIMPPQLCDASLLYCTENDKLFTQAGLSLPSMKKVSWDTIGMW